MKGKQQHWRERLAKLQIFAKRSLDCWKRERGASVGCKMGGILAQGCRRRLKLASIFEALKCAGRKGSLL